MPSKEFEKYLSDKDKEQAKEFAEIMDNQQPAEVDQTPADNSHTPAPEDAGKKISGIEDTGKKDALSKYNIRQHDEVVDAGKTLHHHNVKGDDSLEGGDR